jgi:hypothetical protein
VQTGAELPDRDALVMAFGDTIVSQLPRGVARSVFSGGRFVAVSEGHAIFSLENAPTRDRAEKYRAEVEQLLSDHFGVTVPLRLVTDAEVDTKVESPAQSPERPVQAPDRPAQTSVRKVENGAEKPGPVAEVAQSPAQVPRSEAGEDELIEQLDQLPDADVATTSVDRLTDAFPGAQLIDTDEGRP